MACNCTEEVKTAIDKPKPTVSLLDMLTYLLTAISCLCVLPAGVSADECRRAVLAGRDTFYVPEGGSWSLSCVVQHCGYPWIGNWILTNVPYDKLIENSDRYHLTNVTLSANETKLLLNFLKVNQSDEGSYGCKITWGENDFEQGHLTYVNITAAVPSERKLLHRFLACAGTCLCFTVVLGLVCCLRSRVKHQLLSRTQSTHAEEPNMVPKPLTRRPIPKKRSTSVLKAPPQSEQRAEVVYADISKDSLKKQGATREPAHSIVYSSVRFS